MDYGKYNTTGKTTGNGVKNLQVIVSRGRTQKFLVVSFFREMSRIRPEAGLMRGLSHEWSRNGYLKIWLRSN